MSKQNQIRIGILGGWDIARKAYFPILPSWPAVNVIGVYSRTDKTANEVADRWHIDYRTTDIEALINKGIDAAFILTSTDSHYYLAKKLLESDVDIYVEKPATQSSKETQALAELASDKKRIFMVGFNRRYSPLYIKAKEIFGNRKIRQCIVQKHRSGTKIRDLAHTYLDDTVHQIDLLRFFCGEVTPIATYYQIEDKKLRCSTSVAELESGGIGMVLTSREAGMWTERVSLHGGELSVEVNAFRELRIRHPDYEEVYGADRAGRWMPQLKERGFVGEIEHFFDCVVTRKRPQTDGYDSVKTQKLLEAFIEKSVESKKGE
jgi:virulence factor